MSFFPLSDESLDQQLCDVPLPKGLIENLQQVADWSDDEIDAELAAVPVSPVLVSTWMRIASTLPATGWKRLALAASLLLAITLAYGGGLATYLTIAYGNRQPVQDLPDASAHPQPVEVTAGIDQTSDAQVADAADVHSLVDEGNPEIELATVERPKPIPVFPSPFPFLQQRSAEGMPTAELNLEQFGSDVLGSSQMQETLPEWRLLPSLVPHGIQPPRSAGFDLAFLHAMHFNPVVDPTKDKDLLISRVPLSLGQESYLLARRSLAEGELPPDKLVRTEEFLAAMNYGWTTPTRERVALQAAAGPSPFGGNQLVGMLQVGVRSSEVPDGPRQPAHLIVCVDVSSSMQRGARLEVTQAALRSLAARLQPNDRLSLVTFRRDARVLIEEAGRQHSSQLQAAIDSLETQGSANPVAGLQLAYGLAAEGARIAGRTQHVVLLSDNLIRVDSLTAAPLLNYLRGGAGQLARLCVIDLGQTQGLPAHWTELAQAADGQVQAAATTDEIQWVLFEALTGKSQQTATDVSLTVSFNPQTVAGYRLFGHEPTLLAGESQAVLHSGQTSVGLYELQLKPKGADAVATVTLSWRDTKGGPIRTQTKKITRASFAQSFASEPASLQLATYAAEAAELLRHSPYRENFSLRSWRDLAAEPSPSVKDNASFQELSQMMREALTAHSVPQRRGAR